MGKHVFLKVLGGSILFLLLGIYLSSLKQPVVSHAGYPWKIDVLQSGYTRVFSLTIGKSTLGDAEQLFKESAEVTLFVPEHTPAVIEAFFDSVNIANIKSKMVMSISLPADEIQAMFDRGVRIATLGSGTRKVTLSSDDEVRVRQSAISAITYLPSSHLDAELVTKRFGQPVEKLTDTQSGAIHWLYPQKGLDIVLSDTDKEVIQYVMPQNFKDFVQPLRAANN